VNREAGDPQGIATSLFGLATIALVRGDAKAAMEFAQEGLGLTRETGERGQVPPRLEILAASVGASGDATRAAQLFGAAASLREIVGLPLPAMAPPDYEQRVAAVRSALGDLAFDAAWATGRALKLDDVLAESIAEVAAPTLSASVNHPAQAQPRGLTPRELMVLRLLVEGHSDPEIAEALFVSRRTVATHVVHIFRKLGVHSRAAASAHAVRLGLA
jgi:DNA-binding CsgD family transcriptional regulator